MSRWLTIPAVCCLVAFAGLYAVLHGALGGEATIVPQPLSAAAIVAPPSREFRPVLSTTETEQVLVTLRDAYLRPWNEWQTSPHHMFSRVAPKPIPSISAEIQLALLSAGQTDGCQVGLISVSKRGETHAIPCVVDRLTSRVQFFHNGRWLTSDEWLATAPVP